MKVLMRVALAASTALLAAACSAGDEGANDAIAAENVAAELEMNMAAPAEAANNAVEAEPAAEPPPPPAAPAAPRRSAPPPPPPAERAPPPPPPPAPDPHAGHDMNAM